MTVVVVIRAVVLPVPAARQSQKSTGRKPGEQRDEVLELQHWFEALYCADSPLTRDHWTSWPMHEAAGWPGGHPAASPWFRVVVADGNRFAENRLPKTTMHPKNYDLSATRTARSSASRNRDRSALENAFPPPCRKGSAARRSVIKSRVASALPTFATVSASPFGFKTAAPALDATRRQWNIRGNHHIPRPYAVGDPHVSHIRGRRRQIRFPPMDWAEGRMPPFETMNSFK